MNVGTAKKNEAPISYIGISFVAPPVIILEISKPLTRVDRLSISLMNTMYATFIS